MARALPRARRSSSKATNDDEKSERRRLRNRVSQQAFRARQSLRVQELEEQLEYLKSPEAARVAQLQEQNVALRDQLLACHKKLTSFEISIQQLRKETAQVLGIESIAAVSLSGSETGEMQVTLDQMLGDSQQDFSEEDSPRATESQNSSWASLPVRNDIVGISSDPASLQPLARSQHLEDSASSDPQSLTGTQSENSHAVNLATSREPQETVSGFQFCHDDPLVVQETSDDDQQVVFGKAQFPYSSLSWDIGPSSYHDALSKSPSYPTALGNVRLTNSTFSDHINTVQACCMNALARKPRTKREVSYLADLVRQMLSAFINISWSSMGPWHTYTKALGPLQDFMTWKITKSHGAYLDITPAYRPTKLQATAYYPSVIDWIPWPSLRDSVITHHAANPNLDKLICEIGNAYVVPTDLSLLVSYDHSVLGHVGVWDLVRAINPSTACLDTTRFANNLYDYFNQNRRDYSTEIFGPDFDCFDEIDDMDEYTCRLPAIDENGLFSSRTLALQAFKLLGMDRGAFAFQLAPEFFEKHPELYDSTAGIMATGVRLRPNVQVKFPAPRELDSGVVAQYQALSSPPFSPPESTLLVAA